MSNKVKLDQDEIDFSFQHLEDAKVEELLRSAYMISVMLMRTQLTR